MFMNASLWATETLISQYPPQNKISEEAFWGGTQREDDSNFWWHQFSKVGHLISLLYFPMVFNVPVLYLYVSFYLHRQWLKSEDIQRISLFFHNKTLEKEVLCKLMLIWTRVIHSFLIIHHHINNCNINLFVIHDKTEWDKSVN